MVLCISSDGSGTQNPGFRVLEVMPWRNVFFKGKLNKAFLHFFCQIFGIFNDFTKFCSTFGALHFEKSSNMAKNEEKPCLTCLKLA